MKTQGSQSICAVSLESAVLAHIRPKIYVIQVTYNFKVGTVGSKVFYLHGDDRVTKWLNEKMPLKSPKTALKF